MAFTTFKKHIEQYPLNEAGFSTKTSNLGKYIPMINKDFKMGFEFECYAPIDDVSG